MANGGGDIEPFLPPATAAALGGQAYGMGAFELEDGEAVVLECRPPDCLVWGFSLCDRFFQSIDYDHRQSSLNSHQAILRDGVFHAVIAAEDPGVANWLDCGGHRSGIIAVRYVLPETVPGVHYRKVKLTELDRHLPADIPRVSPQQRSETLRRRRLACQRRN
jgi:hypothetical protein